MLGDVVHAVFHRVIVTEMNDALHERQYPHGVRLLSAQQAQEPFRATVDISFRLDELLFDLR